MCRVEFREDDIRVLIDEFVDFWGDLLIFVVLVCYEINDDWFGFSD